jgi:hypothetical protein
MIKSIVIAALLLVPTLARAEFIITKKSTETRPAAAAKAETLTVDGMLNKINTTYMQGMQRCYVKGLAQDASLEGQVTVVFTINPWGHVSGTVTGIAPKVDACLTSQLASWKFPSPRDAKARRTAATFKLNLLLRQ